MGEQIRRTHVAATLGLVLRGNKILLLKRNVEPRIWAPAGGRLLPDEDPALGLQREISEECKINVEVIMPFDTWFGRYDNALTLGIIYLCRYVDGTISLSPEHSEARWFTEESLKKALNDSPELFFGKPSLYELTFSLDRFIERCNR